MRAVESVIIYTRRGFSGKSHLTNFCQLLQAVYVVRTRKSGCYSSCIHCNNNNLNNYLQLTSSEITFLVSMKDLAVCLKPKIINNV